VGSKIFGTLICLAIGVALIGFGAWEIRRISAASNWPTIEGIVESSRITTSKRSKGGTRYYCKAEYTFTVDGRACRGNTVYLANTPTSSATAHTDLSRFAPGNPCTVHYRPDDPSDCCLEVGSNTTAWILLGFGAFLAIAGVFQGMRLFLP